MAGSNDLKELPKTGMTVTDLMNLISGAANNFSGSKSTQTTDTSGISQDAMNAMLKSILEGTNGLADVASGQNRAGLYGSSVNTQLVNDLMTRAAAQVAMNGPKSQTTTTRTAPKVSGSAAGSVAGLLGLAQVGSSIWDAGKGLLNGDVAYSASEGIAKAKDLLGIGANQGAGTGAADQLTVDYGTGANSLGVTGSATSGSFDTAFDSSVASDGASNSSAAIASSEGMSLNQGVGYAKAAYDSYNDIKDDNWGGAVGSAIGAYYGGTLGETAGNYIGTAVDTYVLDPINTEVLPWISDQVSDVSDTVSNGIESAGDFVNSLDDSCFITTAVCEQFGWTDDCAILQTLRSFRDNFMRKDPELVPFVEQYYAEAPEIVRIINTFDPLSKTDVYTLIYEDFILPAVREIEAGNNHSAYEIYRELFNYAFAVAHGSTE